MINWQPIETAPKDGTRILLYFEGFNEYYPEHNIQIGKWEEDKYYKNPKPYWTCDTEGLWGKRFVRKANVTHWAPLVSPNVDEIPEYELETIDNDDLPAMWHTSDFT